MQIPFLSTATHKIGVACVSGKCRRVGISCKNGSSLALGISVVGELYKC